MLHLDARTLTYETFRAQCLIPNRPAIISHAAADFFRCESSIMARRAQRHAKKKEGREENDSEDNDERQDERLDEANFLALMRDDLSPLGLWNLLGSDTMVPAYRSKKEDEEFLSSASSFSLFSSSLPPPPPPLMTATRTGPAPGVSLSYEECKMVSLREVFSDWGNIKSNSMTALFSPSGNAHCYAHDEGSDSTTDCTSDTHHSRTGRSVNDTGEKEEDNMCKGLENEKTGPEENDSLTAERIGIGKEGGGPAEKPLVNSSRSSLHCTSEPISFRTSTPAPISPSSSSSSPLTYLKDFHFQDLIERQSLEKNTKKVSTKLLLGGQEHVSSLGSSLSATSFSHPSSSCPSWYSAVPHYFGRDWLNDFCRSIKSTQRDTNEEKGKGGPRTADSNLPEEEEGSKRGSEATWENSSTRTTGTSRGSKEDSTMPLLSPPSCAFFGLGGKWGDYRFAYIGPPNTATPLHFDVFGSYSWSLNVCGCKLWYFLSQKSNANLLSSFQSYPNFPIPPDIRVLSDIEPLVCVVQYPGDLVFVPALFLHQVHNISGETFSIPFIPFSVAREGGGGGTDCAEETLVSLPTSDRQQVTVDLVMSVNHNWCNQYNVKVMIENVFLQQDVRCLILRFTYSEIEMMAELIKGSYSSLLLEDREMTTTEIEKESSQENEKSCHNKPSSRDQCSKENCSHNPSNEKKNDENSPFEKSLFSVNVDIVLQHGANWSFRGIEAFLNFSRLQLLKEQKMLHENTKSFDPIACCHNHNYHMDDRNTPAKMFCGASSSFSTTNSSYTESDEGKGNEITTDRNEELTRAIELVDSLLEHLHKAWNATLLQLSYSK